MFSGHMVSDDDQQIESSSKIGEVRSNSQILDDPHEHVEINDII